MSIKNRLGALGKLKSDLSDVKAVLDPVMHKVYHRNKWFTPEFTELALSGIRDQFLDEAKLLSWMAAYPVKESWQTKKNVGIIMAGNLPLVGFHDFLCAYVLGFNQQIKLSSKDEVLLPYLIEMLSVHDSELKGKVQITDRLKGFDAVIATGSNNSNRYFEYYFRNYPKILRKNRHSVAFLTGDEKADQLGGLSDDVFTYFGLGCRNVSKIYLPKGYQPEGLFPTFEKYKWVDDHTSYKNNYDYNRTLLLMNNTPHLSNDFVMLIENKQLSSPLASLHYEFYENKEQLNAHLEDRKNELQCVMGLENLGVHTIPLGQSQQPGLTDYADGVDVMEWLTKI